MRNRFIALIVGVVASFAFAAPAFAENGTLFGGATQQNGVITLVSNLADTSTANDFSGVTLPLDGITTLSSLQYLGAEFMGACGGGSPRFEIQIGGKNVFVYLGPAPNFTGCSTTTWTNTGNLLTSSSLIFDLSQFGGSQYSSYQQALALLGSQTVQAIRLVVDSGWFFPDKQQTVLVRNIRINGTTISPLPTTTSMNPAQTCRMLQQQMGGAAFAAFFGKNANKRNAFGKCVSMVAKMHGQQRTLLTQSFLAAVATCTALQTANPTSFTQTFGAGALGFATCVQRQLGQDTSLSGAARAAVNNAAKPGKPAETPKPKGDHGKGKGKGK